MAPVFALFWLRLPSSSASNVELGAFLLLAALSGGKKVSLSRHRGDSEAVSMSLGFAITFAAMLRFGPVGALSVSVISCLSGCLYPKRQPFFQIAFNVALSSLEAFIGSLVYLELNGWRLTLDLARTLVAVCGATLAYFMCNTGGVAVMIAICSRQNVLRLWKETFLWTGPSYFAGASVSALAMVLLGNHSALLLLFVAPVVFVIYQSYATTTARVEDKLRHAEEMQQNQARLADLYLATIKSLALAIDAKDQYTHQHILRVQRYSVALAKQMGLEGSELEAVNTGALLHDIGKLGVPEYVLLKPGRLTDEEFDMIKKHPEIGAAILGPVEFPWPVLPVVKYHHERWDGSGYPEGLKGEEIPLTARIMAVADVYDALTSSRSYRGAWTHERALQTIIEGAGSHFDVNVVEAFKECIPTVIQEMADEGYGPLTGEHVEPETKEGTTKAAKEISRTSAEYWAIHEVSGTLAACNGIQEAIRLLTDKLEDIYRESVCLFVLEDEQAIGLNVLQLVVPGEKLATAPHSEYKSPLVDQVFQTGDSYFGAVSVDQLPLKVGKSVSTAQFQSVLIVRMGWGGTILGTISLYHPEKDYFVERDAQFMESLAGHLSMNIVTTLASSQPNDLAA